MLKSKSPQLKTKTNYNSKKWKFVSYVLYWLKVMSSKSHKETSAKIKYINLKIIIKTFCWLTFGFEIVYKQRDKII